MLERGNDVLLVLERRVALESLHGRDPHAGDQIGVLAVGFLDASPPRLARHIHDGRQRLVRAARAGFRRRHLEQPAHEFGIERRAQSDGLREARPVDGGVAVQAFLMEDDRDAQPGVLDEELLNVVGQLRHFSGVAAAAGIAGPADLTEAEAILEMGPGFLQVEPAFLVDHRAALLLPDAEHLRDLFFQRHARQQVLDAALDGEFRIAIGRLWLGLPFGLHDDSSL